MKTRTIDGSLVVDPTGGMSGDMFLACLFALGADPKAVASEVAALKGLEPFRIVFGRVKRGGIVMHRVRVEYEPARHARNLREILDMIDAAPLGRRVRDLAAGAFLLLGEAEGRVHGRPLDEVHFHEVGAVDSIVDIVGAMVALEQLGFPPVWHRPFRVGTGTVRIAHGELPLPAPATLELLAGRTVRFSDRPEEIVTPTGAVLMRTIAREIGPERPVTPRRVVMATGTRETAEAPGMLRIVETAEPAGGRTIEVIRTTIDDMNPEIYGWLGDRLFAAGALDVTLTQVLMKKGRPGVLVTIVCEESARDRLVDLLFRETTTLGVRVAREERVELDRWGGTVDTRFGPVAVKFARLPGGEVRCAPEYDACREAAERTGAPLVDVFRAACGRTGEASAGPAGRTAKRGKGKRTG